MSHTTDPTTIHPSISIAGTTTRRRTTIHWRLAASIGAALLATACGSDAESREPVSSPADTESVDTTAMTTTSPGDETTTSVGTTIITTTTIVTTTAEPESSTPVGVIAIGHSGLTAENSDPARPGAPALENSWATGTNTEVDSVYQRLVAVRPDTEGHVVNAATGGAPVSALADQARRALEVVPNPELVIVQTIDNDIRCDGRDTDNVGPFGDALAEALAIVTDAAPDAHILLVGQLGRPRPEFIAELVAYEPALQADMTGTGICDFFAPDGTIAEENFAALTTIIEGYEAEQARVCAAIENCVTDGGVRAQYVDMLANFSSDLNHLNVQGQAAAAELIWPVVVDQLGIE